MHHEIWSNYLLNKPFFLLNKISVYLLCKIVRVKYISLPTCRWKEITQRTSYWQNSNTFPFSFSTILEYCKSYIQLLQSSNGWQYHQTSITKKRNEVGNHTFIYVQMIQTPSSSCILPLLSWRGKYYRHSAQIISNRNR